MHRKRLLLLLGTLFPTLLLSTPAEAQVGYDQFKSVLGQATTKVDKTLVLDTESGKLRGIADREEIETDATGGSWRFVLTGWRTEGGGDVTIFHAQAVVMNYVGRMEYVFLAPEVPGALYDKVFEKTQDLRNEIRGDHDDVTVQFGRQGDQIAMAAEYVYSNGTGGLQDRIYSLMMGSRHLIMKVADEMKGAEKDLRNQLRDQSISALSAGELEIMIDDGLAPVRDSAEAWPAGHWTFNEHDTPFEFFLGDDELILGMWGNVDKSFSEESLSKVRESVNGWLGEKSITGARLEADYQPEFDNVLQVSVIFPLDGSVTGKVIKDGYDELIDHLGPDSRKAIERATEAEQKRLENAANDVRESALTHLGWQDFERLVDDGLEGTWDEKDGWAEGWWEFDFQDIDYELYDSGSSAMLSFYIDASSVAEADRPGVLQAVQSYINEHGPQGASSVEVGWYPEYEHLLWVRATYDFDGSYTGGDFERRYHDFMYVFSPQAASRIHELVDN